MLLLKDDVTIERVIPNNTFPAYMKKHHADWMKQVRATGLNIKGLSLVLVHGTVKTTQWTVAAFRNTEQGQSADVQGTPLSAGNMTFAPSSDVQYLSCVECRSGPSSRGGYSSSLSPSSTALDSRAAEITSSGEPRLQPTHPHSQSGEMLLGTTTQLQNDQCIFLRYYRIKYRVFPQDTAPRTIEAAGRQKLPGTDSNDADASQDDMDVGGADVSLP